MKKRYVILSCLIALIVLVGAMVIFKRENDKKQVVQESIQASVDEKRNDLEDDYIPHAYGDIHDAFPIISGNVHTYLTSEHLDEALMYAYLYVYNEWATEQDSTFEILTLDEVKAYMDSSEITVDYVIDNDLTTLFEISLYGMSDRIQAYYEWYRSDDGYPIIEEYLDTLSYTYLDICDEHPELQLQDVTPYSMNYEQMRELIEYDSNGSWEDFDTSLFTDN